MSAGERFLRRLFDEMEKRYRIEREERRAELREKYGTPIFFVHELLECPHKREMRRKFPEIEVASMYNPRFVIGWLIEEAVKYLLGVKQEQYYWDRQIEVNGEKITIAGGIDSRDPETGKVIEIKYLSSLFNTPHEHHVLQLRIYLWGVREPDGELWMFSPEGVVFIPVQAMSDEELSQLVEPALKGDKIPMWSWECDHCPFERFCSYSISKRRVRKGGGNAQEKES